MVKFFKFILFIVVVVLIFQGCTIQKRVHMPGWYVTSHVLKNANRTQATAKFEKTKSVKSRATIKETTSPEANNFTSPTLVGPSKKIKIKIIKEKVQKLDKYQMAVRVTEQSAWPFQNSIKLNQNSTAGTDKNQDSRKQWPNKLAGGFLGTTLALVAVLPLFLITILLMNGDADGLYEFSVSNKSSVFVQAFQNTFNVVFKIGTALLFIVLSVLLVAAFIGFLYVEYGILGVVLGVLAFALLMVLLIKFFERLLEIFLPGYSCDTGFYFF